MIIDKFVNTIVCPLSCSAQCDIIYYIKGVFMKSHKNGSTVIECQNKSLSNTEAAMLSV